MRTRVRATARTWWLLALVAIGAAIIVYLRHRDALAAPAPTRSPAPATNAERGEIEIEIIE